MEWVLVWERLEDVDKENIMATTDRYTESGGGVGNMLGTLYSYETLRALSAIPRAGFEVPFSGLVGTAGNVGARAAGFDMAFNTRLNIGYGFRTDKPGGRALSRMGAFRSGKRMLRTKNPVLFGQLSKNLIGRSAGMALKGLHLYFGAELLGMGWQGYSAIAQRVRKEKGLELGGYFPETQGSYTSRQRTVRAISDSRLQARSAIGNEAFLFHR